jgi:hypothetical protein
MKLIKEFDGNDLSSFSNFILLPSKKQILFVNPCKITKLDFDFNILAEKEVDFRKGKFQNNMKIDENEALLGV